MRDRHYSYEQAFNSEKSIGFQSQGHRHRLWQPNLGCKMIIEYYWFISERAKGGKKKVEREKKKVDGEPGVVTGPTLAGVRVNLS